MKNASSINIKYTFKVSIFKLALQTFQLILHFSIYLPIEIWDVQAGQQLSMQTVELVNNIQIPTNSIAFIFAQML